MFIPRREVFVSLPAASYQTLHLYPYYQTKPWNPTNHSHEPSTADVSFQPTNHCCSLIQTALLRSNFRQSFEDYVCSLHYTSWQIPRDDDTAASHTCSQPATPSHRQLQASFDGTRINCCTCSYITKQQHLQNNSSFNKMLTSASP